MDRDENPVKKTYYVGNAILKDDDRNEGFGLIIHDGTKYELEGICSSTDVLARLMISKHANRNYLNLPKNVMVEKYKPARVTPLNSQEVKQLKVSLGEFKSILPLGLEELLRAHSV